MVEPLQSVRFNILRNAIYHTARRRSNERRNRGSNFVVLLLGTAAVGNATAGSPLAVEVIGAAVAVIGALQLVFDFGGQARDHQSLQKAYFDLLADAQASNDANAEQIADLQARMLRITAEEPPVLKAIDARAYNDAVDAMGLAQNQRLHIPLIDRLLGGVLAFDGRMYLKEEERSG